MMYKIIQRLSIFNSIYELSTIASIDEQRRFTMKGGGERGKNKIPHLSKGK